MKSLLLRTWTDDTGFDLPEYAMTAAVLVAIVVVMRSLDIHGTDLLANVGIKLDGVPR
jgi:hypothetical protein